MDACACADHTTAAAYDAVVGRTRIDPIVRSVALGLARWYASSAQWHELAGGAVDGYSTAAAGVVGCEGQQRWPRGVGFRHRVYSQHSRSTAQYSRSAATPPWRDRNSPIWAVLARSPRRRQVVAAAAALGCSTSPTAASSRRSRCRRRSAQPRSVLPAARRRATESSQPQPREPCLRGSVRARSERSCGGSTRKFT